MASARFEGTYTALVTPFREDQSIDWDAFDRLIDSQLAGGVSGLVPCGTTGESPTLSHEEHLAVVARTVKRAGARAHVVAGCGSNSTREAIRLSREAEQSGAAAVMIVVPYYNKPTQDGLAQHFVAVAKSVSCPVVVYNIPGRTGVDLLPDTLARHPRRRAERRGREGGDREASLRRAGARAPSFGARLAVLSGDDALSRCR